ncbi:MAG TPA: YezD family protein [Burkholderiales bacterium]|nr:YezD family protein [Burkholderiales bacterium]
MADGNTRQAGFSLAPEVEREIARAVSGIEYGSVEIVIHDGKVVQIERKEKTRFHNGQQNRAGRLSSATDDA